jgi:putative phosphoesterase
MPNTSDPFYILVIADTHVTTIEQLPANLPQLANEAHCVVHCGDFTDMKVVRELRNLSKRFIGVYGNTDSIEVKQNLPYESFFEVQGKRIAVTHPFFGGPPWGLEDELAGKYTDADIILFGHTHDALVVEKNDKLLLNPGQGYPIFVHRATVGILKFTNGEVQAHISPLENAILS